MLYSQNSYAGISGTFIFDAIQKITGQSVVPLTTPTADNFTTFADAFSAGKLIGFATKATTSGVVVANHAYAVINYDPGTQTVTLFNPWGVGIGNGGLITLTWSQILTDFAYFDRTA